MKRFLLIIFSLCSLMAAAQPYNNEWIDYGKKYFKFKVGATGLYRIPGTLLSGMGLGSTNAADFQLWRNGVEVPLFTSAASGALGASGYIEFWGEMNDGKSDLPLYRIPDYQINDKWSLYTDTAFYFLTVNTGGGNRRLVSTANTIPAGATPEPYFVHTTGKYYRDQIHLGNPQGSGGDALYSSSYEFGEGWTSNPIANNQTLGYKETNLFAYTGAAAPTAQVALNVAGDAFNSRSVKLTLNGQEVFNSPLASYNYLKLQNSVPASLLGSNTADFVVSNIATSGTIDRLKVAKIELSYPRKFNFGGSSSFRFQIPARTGGTYLEISGFSFSGTPILYDLNNGRRYQVQVAGTGSVKVFLQPTSSSQELLLVSQDASNLKTITAMEPRSFVNYLLPENQGNYLIITNGALLNGPSGSKPVEDYRAYRASATGGSYSSKIFLADQLIDQFAFGIKSHTLGIRNFSRWARNSFSNPVQYIFIIGKGVAYNLTRVYESKPETPLLNLVPTFGYPASDQLLTSEGSSSMPLTPIGRVSVVNAQDIITYLDKVKQYEQLYASANGSISDNLWKKNVIHMVGANDQPTVDLLYTYLNRHKLIIQDTLYGSRVFDFVKNASGSNQQSTVEKLAEMISSGIGFLTYYGHSSSTGLAFNLENPQNYNNQGRYPILNMMGCNVGNIFGLNAERLTTMETVSEKYVLAKDRGAVAMMAGTSLGYVGPLEEYNRRFYTDMSVRNYGKTIGQLMQRTVKDIFEASSENSLLMRSQCETYTLHGDPALKYYQQAKPDFAIDDQMVSVEPSVISVSEPYFTIKARIANLGKAPAGKLVVEMKRTFPNLTVKVVRRDTIPVVRYMDSIIYQIPIDAAADKGANKFTITIDPENVFDELFKDNNTITKDIYILEDDLKPIYPYNFSIVNRQGIELAASTGNPFALQRNYLMEMDTTKLFNSPVKISQTKMSAGGLVTFTPGATFKDSTVYYWRVAAAPASASEEPAWNHASFTFMAGTNEGFNQGHYYQFLDDNYSGLYLDHDRKFKFNETSTEISVTTSIYPYGTSTNQFILEINQVQVAYGWLSPFSSQTKSLRFYVIDDITLKVMKNKDLGSTGLYGSYRPLPYNGRGIPDYFQFDISTVAARETVMRFLDSIPKGFYVIATNSISGSTVLPEVWRGDTTTLGSGKSLYHKFLEIGASRIGEVTSFVPFIFFMQKGKSTALAQSIAENQRDILTLRQPVIGHIANGSIESVVLGPSGGWQKLLWNGASDASEKFSVDLIGVQENGAQTTLFDNIQPTTASGLDISSIDAKKYPKLKLRLNTFDTARYTPYQLKYWRLIGNFVPEGAIAPNLYFSAKDTLDAGEPMELGIAFKNISNHKFDSIAVKLLVRNASNVETPVTVPRQKALNPGDTIRLTVPVNTAGYGGHNTLYLEFNPPGGQPEQHHFNNFILRDFYVRADTTNPFIDVTFDGAHILNKDIVSAKPHIQIKFTDDAKWLLLNNSDLVKVQLKYPNGSLKDFNFNSDTLVFVPATGAGGEDNTALIHFKPHLLADGNYELIVSAKDQSGNQAGAMQYRVAFQVINKPQISNMLNYPNPFTTSTAFVFTLTGAEVPQNIRIQILTITGKIVKEITKAELGPIKIGRNITEYKWDGTDQYGQKLANGVYLYRVITNLHGKRLDKYKTEQDRTDRYFNKGYGKMYLMR